MRLVLPKKDIDHKLVIQEKGDIKGYTEEIKQFWQAKKGDFLLGTLTGPSKWKEQMAEVLSPN